MNTLKMRAKAGTQLAHVYEPRGACKAMFTCKDAEVLLSGPAGTGKSRACLEKIFMMCLRTPNLRAAIIRKTLASLGSTALVTWRNYVAKEALATGEMVYYGGSAEEPPQYRFKNGSTVTIGGMDKPMRIMSSEYDIVYVQEATELTLEDIEYINTRLRNWKISFQQLLMDCNPSSETHPLYLRSREGKTTLIESRHEDNPVLFDELIADDGTITHRVTDRGAQYIAKLDRLTGVRHKRLRLGLWVSAEGMIYEEFSPAVHILDWEFDADGNRLPLPAEWQRYWVIDFGLVHPFVCQWWAEDEDGRLYMYREIYMTGRIVSDHAQTILEQVTKIEIDEYYDHFNQVLRTRERIEWTEPKPTAIITDHDAEDRRTLERALGMGTQKADKRVKLGIDLVKDRLKQQADGNARLFFMRDTLVEKDQEQVDNLRPTCTLDEIPLYAWKINTKGRTQEEPIKQDDDGMDTTRYIVAFRDAKGKARATQLNI